MRSTTVLFAIVLLAAAGHHEVRSSNLARQPKAMATSNDVIHVGHCRLMFVQKATLASAQAGVLMYKLPKDRNTKLDAEIGEGQWAAAKEITEGTRVKANVIVAGLRDEVPVAQYLIAKKEAENEVDILYAEKAAEVAKSELNKSIAANMTEVGTVPAIEIERLQLAFKRAEFQTKMATEKKSIAVLTRDLRKAEIKRLRIKTPFAGVVTRVHKRPGEAVGNGEPILDIVNPDRVRAEIRVPLAGALKLKNGDRVEVILKLPGSTMSEKERTVEAKITYIDKSVTFTRDTTVRVWAELEKSKLPLFEGLTGSVRIHPTRKSVE